MRSIRVAVLLPRSHIQALPRVGREYVHPEKNGGFIL